MGSHTPHSTVGHTAKLEGVDWQKFASSKNYKGEVKLVFKQVTYLHEIPQYILEHALPAWNAVAQEAADKAKAACPRSDRDGPRYRHTQDWITGKGKLNPKKTTLVGYIKTNSYHGLWPEIGTLRTSAQPFLRPARNWAVESLKDLLRGLV